jgi:hypothetical protein
MREKDSWKGRDDWNQLAINRSFYWIEKLPILYNRISAFSQLKSTVSAMGKRLLVINGIDRTNDSLLSFTYSVDDSLMSFNCFCMELKYKVGGTGDPCSSRLECQGL